MTWREKFGDWLKRYGPAEVISFAAAILSAQAALWLSGSILVSAFATTWSTNLFFYGTLAWQELARQRRQQRFGFKAYALALRNLVLEFGPGEYLDSFVVRPFYLAALPLVIADYSVAIAAGTLLADVTYFVPVIFSYEARKKFLGE